MEEKVLAARAFAREAEMQLVGLLSHWERVRYLGLCVGLWLRYWNRIRFTAAQLPAPAKVPQEQTFAEAFENEPHFGAELARVIALEQLLISAGKRSVLLARRDQIELAAHHALWNQVNAIQSSRGTWTGRWFQLATQPRQMLCYFLRCS